MTRLPVTQSKINTEVTQPESPARRPQRSAARGTSEAGRRVTRVDGDVRESVRGEGRQVIEMDHGIKAYPPESAGKPWRAVFTENGRPRYRQAPTEAKLAEKLEKDRERLAADAVNMERPGADLIAFYLAPEGFGAGRSEWAGCWPYRWLGHWVSFSTIFAGVRSSWLCPVSNLIVIWSNCRLTDN